MFLFVDGQYEIESYVSKTTLVIMIYHGIGVKPPTGEIIIKGLT